MKNLKKFLPLLVLALLILAACTNPLSKKTPEVQVDNEVVEQPVITEDATSVEISDLTFGPNMKCSMLKDSDNRQNCEIQVNEMIGVMLEHEITSSFDAKRCKELPASIAEMCRIQLTESGVQGPVSDEDKVIFNEAMRGTSPDITEENGEGETPFLFPVYDVVKCAQLKTPGYKAYCEKLVTERIERNKLEQIIEAGDVARCDELEAEDYKMECKLSFGVDIASLRPPASVEEIPTESLELDVLIESPEDATAQ